jgi:hypothetical protein
VSKLQTLIATCGKPMLAIGLHSDDVRRALAEHRVAWIALERHLGADRASITFAGTDGPDLVFLREIPAHLRDTIADPSWTKPDDVLAAIGVE